MLRVSWLYRQREVKAAGVKFRPEEVMYSRWEAQTPFVLCVFKGFLDCKA